MDFIAIGKVVKPIGTRGEVKVLPLTHDVRRFSLLHSVWIGRDETGAEERKICDVHADSRRVQIRIEGIGTAQDAEKLRGMLLYVPKENRVEPSEGSYFVDDILGCDVFTEEGKNIGMVTDLLTLPAHDVWVVRNGKKEILVPAVKAIVRVVDVVQKRITIHALEGMLE